MIYVLLSSGLLVFSGFAYFFPRQYISELFLSFLPYWSGIFLMGLIVSVVYMRRYMRRYALSVMLPWWYKLSGLFSLCFAILFYLSSHQITHFYSTHLPSSGAESGFRVLFANIHKNNTQYSGLQDLIVRTNPDMVLFVEFADHHYTHLKSFLRDRYPYTNSTTWSKQFVGSMVFSKQKIENRADDFPQGMWRYGYFSLNLSGQTYYFYLIHTSSPDSYPHFIMRNNQISSFDRDFAAHALERFSKSPVVVVGDFNTTPWSAYYQDIERVFSGTLVNVSSSLPFLRTWRMFGLPLFQAHIDHVWASSGSISAITDLSVGGSDHSAYLFTLQ